MRLRKMESVDQLFVLASMTRPTHKVTGKELERIHRSQGFSKIAVHFVIERDGTLFKGRPDDEPGCLAPGANHRSLQVCVVGGIDDALAPTDNFTKQQKASLRKLIANCHLPVVYDRTYPREK